MICYAVAGQILLMFCFCIYCDITNCMQKQQAERVALKNNSASCIIDFSSQTITSHKAPVLHGSSSLVRIATVKDLKQIMLGTVRKQIQQTPRNQKPRCIIILQDTKRKQTK